MSGRSSIIPHSHSFLPHNKNPCRLKAVEVGVVARSVVEVARFAPSPKLARYSVSACAVGDAVDLLVDLVAVSGGLEAGRIERARKCDELVLFQFCHMFYLSLSFCLYYSILLVICQEVFEKFFILFCGQKKRRFLPSLISVKSYYALRA